MSTFSKEHIDYLKKQRIRNILIHLTQIIIVVLVFSIWEILAKINIINTFLYSSPSRILNTITNLLNERLLFNHISITIYEVLIIFRLASISQIPNNRIISNTCTNKTFILVFFFFFKYL